MPELTLADGLSREYLLHHRLCPRAVTAEGVVMIAAAPDALLSGVDDIAFAYRREVAVESASPGEVDRLIERLTTRAERAIELARPDSGDDDFTTDVRDLANQPPVVRYVNLLVRDAYDAGASDIHLEAGRSGLLARFRLDGVLTPATEPPAHMHHAVVSQGNFSCDRDSLCRTSTNRGLGALPRRPHPRGG